MKTIKNHKKPPEAKLKNNLVLNKDFLVERLRGEWDQIQKGAKREYLVRQAKAGVSIAAKTILVLLLAGGILTVAAVAPNIFGAYGRLTGRRGFFEKKNFNQTKKYLLKQKYIETTQKDKDKFELSLTQRGLEKALYEGFRDLKIDKQKPWDGFWRIVIFDIPNRHKWAREGFREKLKLLGFYPLQESVFISPYFCEKEIIFLVSIFCINSYVRLVKTQHLDNDGDIRKFFGLP